MNRAVGKAIKKALHVKSEHPVTNHSKIRGVGAHGVMVEAREGHLLAGEIELEVVVEGVWITRATYSVFSERNWGT